MYKRNTLKVLVSVFISISEYACPIVPSTATMLELYRVSCGGSTLATGSPQSPHIRPTSRATILRPALRSYGNIRVS